jgi:copper chaperone CopZ
MQTIELTVTGMMCGACQGHVTKALQNTQGVQNAVVDLAAGKASVQGENLDAARLIAAVEEEGYGAKVGE